MKTHQTGRFVVIEMIRQEIVESDGLSASEAISMVFGPFDNPNEVTQFIDRREALGFKATWCIEKLYVQNKNEDLDKGVEKYLEDRDSNSDRSDAGIRGLRRWP